MEKQCHVVRVFTRSDVGGNHLGVVVDGGALTGNQMQAMAAELGFSETVFFLAGDPPRVRIFTPGREMPFAGHPMVGMTWVARYLGLPVTDRLMCGIGEVAVGATDSTAWIEVGVERPVRPVREAAVIARSLGLPEPLDAAWVDMPIPYLLLELSTGDAVAAAAFSAEALAATEVGELCLFGVEEGDRARMRFFAPEAGVFEDPATGSAAVAVASMLFERGRPDGKLTIEQGDELGHPSIIALSWSDRRIRIGGDVRFDEVRYVAVSPGS